MKRLSYNQRLISFPQGMWKKSVSFPQILNG